MGYRQLDLFEEEKPKKQAEELLDYMKKMNDIKKQYANYFDYNYYNYSTGSSNSGSYTITYYSSNTLVVDNTGSRREN